MEQLHEEMGVIIGFLILLFLVSTFMGQGAGEKFSLLVLFTMLILNADKVSDVLTNTFK